MAAIADNSEFLFLLQDDDVPPDDCSWIQIAISILQNFPDIGLIGMNVAEVDGSHETRMKTSNLCLHNLSFISSSSSSSSSYKSPTSLHQLNSNLKISLPIRIQFVCTVDLGPIVVRQSLFHQLGGFDKSLAPAGSPGIGLDFDLSWRIWAAGSAVAHMPMPFSRRQVRVGSRRNTQNRALRRELHAAAQRRIADRFHEALRPKVRERVAWLNANWFSPCMDKR